MMKLSHEQWNANVNVANYDQAWSMVHFLAHGENGKYQPAFGAFMVQIGRGKTWQEGWKQTFGDAIGFEQRWRQFWIDLPDDPTMDLYVKANVAAWTSYLARAVSQKQNFESFDSLLDAGSRGELKSHEDDWLPPVLLAEAVYLARQYMKDGNRYELVTTGRLPLVTCTLQDGRRITGKFTLRNDRVGTVSTQIDKPASRPARGP